MANTTVTPTTLALVITSYSSVLEEIITPVTLALADTQYEPTVQQSMTVEDSGGDSEALSLLIDALLREIAGVAEDIAVENTPESVGETGTGTDVVTVVKTQSCKVFSTIRPLYVMHSVIRGLYEMSPTVRGLYEFHTKMKGG